MLRGRRPVNALGTRPGSLRRDHPRVDEPLDAGEGKLYPASRRAFEEAAKRIGVTGIGPYEAIGVLGTRVATATLLDGGENAFVGGGGYGYSGWPPGSRGGGQRNGSAAGSTTSLPQVGQVMTSSAEAGKVSPHRPQRYTPSDIFCLGCFLLIRKG